MSLPIVLYLLALLSQVLATAYAIYLFFHAKAYRLGVSLLAIAFGLMVGRRLVPIGDLYIYGHVNLVDAVLAAIISVLICWGLIEFKKILLDLEARNHELSHVIKIDSLTGALSRTETFSRSEIEIDRSLRSGHPISFLMVDIDHFKHVNDEFGHLAGDAVLINLVKLCQEELRAIDIFGRVGGEEFFIVLPESTRQQAHQVAERLRTCVAGNSILVGRDVKICITISIGVATFDPKVYDRADSKLILRNFLKLSDDAMYQAKSEGRNRTVIYKESTCP